MLYYVFARRSVIATTKQPLSSGMTKGCFAHRTDGLAKTPLFIILTPYNTSS